MPILQEKIWESWELRRLLLGKANSKMKKDCPTDGTWDLFGFEHFASFLFVLIFLSLLVSFVLRYCPIWEKKEREVSLSSLLYVCVCVCAIVVYPRAAEYHRAV
jgi:hypothetical protein